MRIVLVLAALAACEKGKSKLDVDRGSEVDALWDLAPDGTQLGIVASPRAVGLAFRGIAAVRELTALPDLGPAKPQIDLLAKGLFGSETAGPADAGFADRGFAMFATADGVLGIMPVVDRDKFMASKKGTRGSAEDTLDGNTCRPIGQLYVCASEPKMFDRLGKGSLKGKLNAGARGDAELYMTNLALLGEARGDLVVALQLEAGQVSAWGRWNGTPSGPFDKLVGVTAPTTDTKGASGFVALDIKPLLASMPPLPLAGGVSLADLGTSLAGPLSAVIPAGSVDIQVHAPLADAAPATKIVENCQDIGQFFELAKTQTPGACRIVLQGNNALELDAWVDGTTLRLGAKKGAAPVGKAGALTPIGRELATGTWTAAFWGRGTMLNLAGIAPATADVAPEIALGIHAIALVNELGAAVKVERDGVRMRAFLRTSWTNPPDVIAKLTKITGNEIVTGKATEPAKAIAQSAPGSPFAADFAAGQGGLMIPAAAIGLVSAVVVPVIARALSPSEGGDEEHGPAMNEADLASLLVRAYATEAYPQWAAKNPGKKCPEKLADLAAMFGDNPGIPVLEDPWGHALILKCDAKGVVVLSVGPDGKEGTDDDVRP